MAEHDFAVSTVYSYENEARIAALAKVDVTGAMQDQVQVGDGGSLLDVVGPSKAQNAPANVAAEPQKTQLESVTPARAKKNLTPKWREHWGGFQEHIKFEQKARKARAKAKAKLQETGQAQSEHNATVELAAESVAQPIESKAQRRRENKEKHAQANLIDLQSPVSTLSGSHTPPFSPGLSIAPPLPSPFHKPAKDKPFSSFSIYQPILMSDSLAGYRAERRLAQGLSPDWRAFAAPSIPDMPLAAAPRSSCGIDAQLRPANVEPVHDSGEPGEIAEMSWSDIDADLVRLDPRVEI